MLTTETHTSDTNLPATVLGGGSGTIRLIVRCGDAAQEVTLTGPKATIGAAPECSLKLDGDGVQPVETVLLQSPETVVIRCWSDSVLLNGQPFDDVELSVNDQFTCGPFMLEVAEICPPSQPLPGCESPLPADLPSLATGDPIPDPDTVPEPLAQEPGSVASEPDALSGEQEYPTATDVLSAEEEVGMSDCSTAESNGSFVDHRQHEPQVEPAVEELKISPTPHEEGDPAEPLDSDDDPFETLQSRLEEAILASQHSPSEGTVAPIDEEKGTDVVPEEPEFHLEECSDHFPVESPMTSDADAALSDHVDDDDATHFDSPVEDWPISAAIGESHFDDVDGCGEGDDGLSGDANLSAEARPFDEDSHHVSPDRQEDNGVEWADENVTDGPLAQEDEEANDAQYDWDSHSEDAVEPAFDELDPAFPTSETSPFASPIDEERIDEEEEPVDDETSAFFDEQDPLTRADPWGENLAEPNDGNDGDTLPIAESFPGACEEDEQDLVYEDEQYESFEESDCPDDPQDLIGEETDDESNVTYLTVDAGVESDQEFLNSSSLERPKGRSEESIEDYMQRLLVRVGSSSSKTEDDSDLSDQETDSASLLRSRTEDQEPEEEDEEDEEPSMWPPTRKTAPERATDLAAMRELANETARTAISKHAKHKKKSMVKLKLFLSFSTLLASLILLTLSQFRVNFLLMSGIMLLGLSVYLGLDCTNVEFSLGGKNGKRSKKRGSRRRKKKNKRGVQAKRRIATKNGSQ